MATRGKASSASLDPDSAARSGLESILRIPSFAEGDKGLLSFTTCDEFIDDESKEYEKKQFVKLKRDHWIDPRSRSSCLICKKSFGLTSKKFNCRRCGEIFCEKCCHYRRRLSPDGRPSSDGHYYRVCYRCSDHDVQTAGITRSLTDFFERQRSSKRINVLKELDRLVEGFRSNVKASRLHSVMTETFSNIKVPLWQRSYKWLESKEVEWCSKCSGKFTLFMQKHHCRICGSVFCSKCSSQDLMLYNVGGLVAQWALIRVVGCPDEEPDVCIYLTICALCHEEVENIQVSRFYETNPDNQETNDKSTSLAKLVDKLNVCQEKIKDSLILYQEMVENMVDGKGKLNEISESGKSVVQTFAKLQVDVTDLFNNYAGLMQELKPKGLLTRKESIVLYNVLHVKSKFYSSNISTFKFYKENLSKTLPVKALKQVQDYADKQAINSTRITTRLLGLEALHLTTKHSLNEALALQISRLDEICLGELREFILYLGDDWEEHSERLDTLVKEMFAKKRMIVPSERLIRKQGTSYVQSFLLERCCQILKQTEQQMLARSSEKKFCKSKETMKALIESTQSVSMQVNGHKINRS